MRKLILVLIVFSRLGIKAQNLISNPDFSDVTIYFQNGKKVFPNNWKSMDWPPFPQFYHPAKIENIDLFGKLYKKNSEGGIVGIHLVHPSEGIETKLNSSLEFGRKYTVEIELKIHKLKLNSDFSGLQYRNGRLLDSTDLDYNYPISLITYFSSTEKQSNNEERNFVIFDLPKHDMPDSTNWLKLIDIYTAKGNEEYFAIGVDDTQNYIEILKKLRNDTINYENKFACYLIRKVNIFPENKESIQIAEHFESSSDLSANPNQRFIIKRINFNFSSAELTDISKLEIQRIASFMNKNSVCNLKIVGHTDTIGTTNFNQILSEKRAFEVYQYLISLGIEKRRLSYEGKGEEKLLEEKLMKMNDGINRRVEFEFK